MTGDKLREYLDKESSESKEFFNLSTLDELVAKELSMDIANRSATSRMKSLFIQYHSLLAKQGLSWIISDNQKLAVSHVLSAIRPNYLKERLESDLNFSHYNLKKDFNEFLLHAVKVSEAFQIVDAGRRKRNRNDGKDADKNQTGKTSPGIPKPEPDGSTEVPLCLWPPHATKGYRHLLKDCKKCPPEEKKKLLAARAAKLAETGPHSGLRSAKTNGSSSTQSPDDKYSPKAHTTGRLTNIHSSPGCLFTLSDNDAEVTCKGRCDDGSDETLISPRIAERAALQGIGKINSIAKVSVQVALKEDSSAETFTFSRSLSVPRTLMDLSSGQLELLNFTFLIADGDLADEDLLIGQPILAHLGIDSRTMLENNRSSLDVTDCSKISTIATDKSSKVGRVLLARISKNTGISRSPSVENKLDPNRPKSDYTANRNDPDPFPNPSLIDIEDGNQAQDIDSGIEAMLQDALRNGFPQDDFEELKTIVTNHRNVFRTTFSSGPPANVPPLRVLLKPDAVPTIVKLRRYTPSQLAFLRKLQDKLTACGYISQSHVAMGFGPASRSETKP